MEKIVLIGPVYPYKGGISHYTTLMYRALKKHYDVKMVSYKMQYPKILFKKEQKDYSSDSFKIEEARFWINTADPFNIRKVGRKIADMKPKAVIIQWWHPYFAPCYKILTGVLKKHNIPVIFICHNVFPHERFPMDKFLTKMTLKMGSGYIVQSAMDEKDLLGIVPGADHALTPHPTYNAFRIRNISREEAREELGIEKDRPMLLFFGFIREYKGLKVLLNAMPRILEKKPETRLYVVGDFGSDKEDYMQLIRDLKLEDSIVIRDGYVPDGEVEPYFAACDLVVLPYLSATQSGIVQIAYGFEKPVVVTNVGGLPDVVPDGKTGYVAEADNQEIFADAVVRFFAEDKAQEFHENITEEAAKYSWDVMCDRIDEVLEKIDVKLKKELL